MRRAVEGIWEAHLPALDAFLEISGQWRVVARGQAAQGQSSLCWIGLDYTAVQAGFALAGRTVLPELWAEVTIIEDGALAELNG